MIHKLYTTVDAKHDYVGLNQIITRWEELGAIERIQIPMGKDGRYISWVDHIGNIALEPSQPLSISKDTPYRLCLTNQYRIDQHSNNPKILPWHFFVRDLKAYEEVQAMALPKKYLSIFSGTIRGATHSRNKFLNSTEIWSSSPARRYNNTNRMFPTLKDYYIKMSECRYGIALGGDGGPISSCQREFEYMGQGVVGIWDSHVAIDWYDPPLEGVHYLRADTPEEMHDKIKNTSIHKWTEMSNACKDYYEEYITPKGLWSTVEEVLDE